MIVLLTKLYLCLSGNQTELLINFNKDKQKRKFNLFLIFFANFKTHLISTLSPINHY